MKTSLIAGILVVLLALAAFWLWTPDKDRRALEAKYLAAPADMVDVAGVYLHVRDTGPKTAPALILVHGFGGSLHTWEAWAKVLEKEFRVIRFDLPGGGLSAPDPTGDYSDARSTQLLIALMDQLQLPKASLIGNSIGGRIAWTFASHHPQRVDKLVLLAPDGFASPGFDYGVAPKVPAALRLMRYVLPRPLLRMNLAPAYADPGVMTDDLLTRYHDLMLAPGSRDALFARMQQTVLTDPVPWLRRIEAPTLLVWGEADAFIPIANAADYLKALPHGTLVRLPGVGHLPQEEAPERSLTSVLEFLKR